jgi:hypothetical protein
MARLASVPDLDQELDRLYGVAPEAFVTERDALAARLRQAHQADAAAAIAKLKKPVAVASAANRLAREETTAVRRLLTASEQLRAAQKRALAGRGGAAEVAEAQAEERGAVDALVAAARSRLEPPVTGTALDRLGQTLRAAAADPSAAELLERGRLTNEVHASGFAPVDGLAPASRRPRRATDEVAAAARARLKALREEARTLAAAARAAERAAASAERAADALRAEADAGQAAAQRAADEVAQAEAALRKRS